MPVDRRPARFLSKPVGPYSPIARAGDWLVVSGQIGMGDGRLVSGGAQDQLRAALDNVVRLLDSEGATLEHVVKTTIFLRHLSDYAAINQVYADAFGDHRPARSAVGVAELPLNALVEIEAWAWVGE